MTFEEKLSRHIAHTGSNLCIGLDPRPNRIDGDVGDFLRRVVGETTEWAAAYKPNIAYFEAMGSDGYRLLENLLEAMPDEVPVILDCKRSDIGETQRYYAKAYFENWQVDAVTLNPFMGFDSIEPFLEYEGRGVYLLALTSNPGASEFLGQQLNGRYVFEWVHEMRDRAVDLPGSVGLVMGLTNLDDEVLGRVNDVPLLIPGLGAQGGDLSRLQGKERHAPLLVNASRGILYGEPDKSFETKAREYVEKIREAFAN